MPRLYTDYKPNEYEKVFAIDIPGRNPVDVYTMCDIGSWTDCRGDMADDIR